jgi:hypothetical protein
MIIRVSLMLVNSTSNNYSFQLIFFFSTGVVSSRLVDTLLIVPFRRQKNFPTSSTTFIFPFCRQLRMPLIDRNLIIKHMVD